MAYATSKRKRAKGTDRFAEDQIKGEYEKPGPSMDRDAAIIADALSKISGDVTPAGVVLRWSPPWAKRAKIAPFSFFFFGHRLAVDFFNRERAGELDANADDLTAAQRQEIAGKTAACKEHGLGYLYLGPDDELTSEMLAARIGKSNFKKGARPPVKAGRQQEAITEEGDEL